MRKLLFNLIAAIGAGLIVALQTINQFLVGLVALVSQQALKLIDSTRLSAYEQLSEAPEEPSELRLQGLELRLLASANQVRDHAKAMGDWTEHHTEAIEAVSEALVAELGWEEESVHQYMKSLVESIDGLEYDRD